MHYCLSALYSERSIASHSLGDSTSNSHPDDETSKRACDQSADDLTRDESLFGQSTRRAFVHANSNRQSDYPNGRACRKCSTFSRGHRSQLSEED
jgi:hypothetical protein